MKTFFKISSLMVVIAMLAFACQKETVSPQSEDTLPVVGMKAKFDLCVCHGFTLSNTNGEWSCPSGTGCAKITSCPCGGAATATSRNFHVKDYQKFLEDLHDGTLTDFFRGGKYKKVFPALDDDLALLDDLRSGAATIVSRSNAIGSTFHFAVNANFALPGTAFATRDVRMAVEIPAGTF